VNQNPETKNLREMIIATLAYHDILEMPLTAVEIWRYLIQSKDLVFFTSLKEVENELCRFVEERVVFFQNGYFAFPGREKLINRRIRRHALAQKKWKRLRRVAWFLQMIPFLSSIAVSGSLSREAAKKDSDLDVLLITSPGRIWTVRFIITVLLDFFGIRRRPTGPTKDLVCLNHYISSDALHLPYQSLYTAIEYARIVPLYGEKGVWKFREINSGWMRKYLSQVLPDFSSNLKSVPNFKIFNFIKWIGEKMLSGKFGEKIENSLGRMQKEKISKNSEVQSSGGRIVASSLHLEFHPHSHEAPLLDEFNRKMCALGLLDFSGQKDSGLS